jgi:hypothetical protein
MDSVMSKAGMTLVLPGSISFRVYLVAAILFCVTACAHRPETVSEQQVRIDALTESLRRMAPHAPRARAREVAILAVKESSSLRQQYGVRWTPWLHNVEVNSGTRSRGHCYHYARDLRQTLQPVVVPYWQLHILHARPGTWLEHNAISISGVNMDWQDSVVLDAWRDAGVLYFGSVRSDRYDWQLRE